MTARRYQHTRPAPRLERGEDWREYAACLGHEATFDLAADHPNDETIVRDALTICLACPVAEICASELMGLEHGVVGGLTEYQRRDIRRGRRPRPLPPVTPEPERPFACPACEVRSVSRRGLTQHWTLTHSPETGTCIRGHDYTPGSGRCQQCRKENGAIRHRAGKQEGAA